MHHDSVHHSDPIVAHLALSGNQIVVAKYRAFAHRDCCNAIRTCKKVHWTIRAYLAQIEPGWGAWNSAEDAMPNFEINYAQDGKLIEKLSFCCETPMQAKVMAHAMKSHPFAEIEVWLDDTLVYERPQLPTRAELRRTAA
jgi:hypothetical protein